MIRLFITLIKRIWLEWRVIIIGFVTVVLLLNLLPEIFTSDNFAEHRTSIFKKDSTSDNYTVFYFGIDFRVDGEYPKRLIGLTQLSESESLTDARALLLLILKMTMPVIVFVVLVFAVFYFADCLHKERSDNTTYFYRSLPISDHTLLFCKIVVGLVGIVILSLFLNIVMIFTERLAAFMANGPVADAFVEAWRKLGMVDIAFDSLILSLAAMIRFAPAALYLMLVSACVKTRPVLLGAGVPVVIVSFSGLIFKEHIVTKAISQTVTSPFKMFEKQIMSIHDGTTVEALTADSFVHHLYSVEALVSLGIAGLLYVAAFYCYRRNIST